MLGESKADQQKRIQQATQNANDLSGLVKHRKKPASAKAEEATDGTVAAKGKRKAGDSEVEGNGADGKKVKFENGA